MCVCVDFPELCDALFPLMCYRGYLDTVDTCFCELDNELMFVYTVCVCACVWVSDCVCVCLARMRSLHAQEVVTVIPCGVVLLYTNRVFPEQGIRWRASSRARLCSPLESNVPVVELVCLLGILC